MTIDEIRAAAHKRGLQQAVFSSAFRDLTAEDQDTLLAELKQVCPPATLREASVGDRVWLVKEQREAVVTEPWFMPSVQQLEPDPTGIIRFSGCPTRWVVRRSGAGEDNQPLVIIMKML